MRPIWRIAQVMLAFTNAGSIPHLCFHLVQVKLLVSLLRHGACGIAEGGRARECIIVFKGRHLMCSFGTLSTASIEMRIATV